MSAFNSSVAGPTPRGRQAKATKGHNMLTAGLRRLRTLSGVYHGRSRIHFVPDANQDPDLDQASSTNPSRPQSAESAPSSGAAPLGNIINSASDVNPSFAGSWSEPRDDDCGSSPSTLSAFEDSSIASDDTSSAIGALLPSVCPCSKPNQSTTTSVGTFNVRMGLRHLPSIVPKATTKLHLQSHQTTQHQQPGSSPSSTVDIHLEKTGSSINTCPSSPCEVRNASTLGCSVYVSGSDQSSPMTPESLQYKEGATTPRTGGIKTKLGWSGKKNHRHTQSASIGHTGSIPFPCSTQDDPEMTPSNSANATAPRAPNLCSAAISGPFQFNGSERLLMPSARLFAGSGPAKLHSVIHPPKPPSKLGLSASARNLSMRSWIQAPSLAIARSNPDDDLSWHNLYRYRHLATTRSSPLTSIYTMNGHNSISSYRLIIFSCPVLLPTPNSACTPCFSSFLTLYLLAILVSCID
ncbi:hypothetical protein PSTT_04318 [Puccinia striiformis]|uniref:Uncharacterized protein n=1 Tax=Puccinia striiformis TaxID=27350 RepID=A0A2S4VTA1_9BASI|nr:hypothetical protein PSTT_04318 [Puccinia striiformis]